MTRELNLLCGGRGRRTTIIDGLKDDPMAKLITCKTCLRLWKKVAR